MQNFKALASKNCQDKINSEARDMSIVSLKICANDMFIHQKFICDTDTKPELD